MGDFVAFEAAVSLAREQGLETLLEEVYLAAKADLDKPVSESQNEVKRLYEALDTDAISARISALLTLLTLKPKWRFSIRVLKDCTARRPNIKAIGTLREIIPHRVETEWPIAPISTLSSRVMSAPTSAV